MHRTLSFKDKHELYNGPQLEHVTKVELSTKLRDSIDDSFEHIYDNKRHITQEDRDRWNSMVASEIPETAKKMFMTPEEKTKLDSVEWNANHYVHPLINNTFNLNDYYLRLTVDEYGHVIFADNPVDLNITVSDANSLGGFNIDNYLKKSDPTLSEAPITKTITDTNDLNQPVNVEYMKSNTVHSLYEISDTAPDNTNTLWISTDLKMIKYYNTETSEWTELKTDELIETDSDGRLLLKYFKNLHPLYPIGAIVPNTNMINPSCLDDYGFIPLIGQELKRNEYPKLFKYANACTMVDDKTWNDINTVERRCGFFSNGDGKTTFRVPNFNNSEVRQLPKLRDNEGNVIKHFGGYLLDSTIPVDFNDKVYNTSTTDHLRSLFNNYQESYTGFIDFNYGEYQNKTTIDGKTYHSFDLSKTYNELDKSKSIAGIFQLGYADFGNTNQTTFLNNKLPTMSDRNVTYDKDSTSLSNIQLNPKIFSTDFIGYSSNGYTGDTNPVIGYGLKEKIDIKYYSKLVINDDHIPTAEEFIVDKSQLPYGMSVSFTHDLTQDQIDGKDSINLQFTQEILNTPGASTAMGTEVNIVRTEDTTVKSTTSTLGLSPVDLPQYDLYYNNDLSSGDVSGNHLGVIYYIKATE